MYKALVMAALATVVVVAAPMPAAAQDAASTAPTQSERMEKAKQKMEERYQARSKKIEQRRSEWDGLRADCHAKMKAVTTPEQMKYIREQCQATGKEMHQKYKSERQGNREKAKDNRQQRREQRQGGGTPAAE